MRVCHKTSFDNREEQLNAAHDDFPDSVVSKDQSLSAKSAKRCRLSAPLETQKEAKSLANSERPSSQRLPDSEGVDPQATPVAPEASEIPASLTDLSKLLKALRAAHEKALASIMATHEVEIKALRAEMRNGQERLHQNMRLDMKRFVRTEVRDEIAIAREEPQERREVRPFETAL